MKKIYIIPQQICISMEKELPIIAASGGGDDPITPVDGDGSIGGGNNDGLPIEEGGAPAFGFIED